MNRSLRRQQKKMAKKGVTAPVSSQSAEALQAGLQRHQSGDLAGAELIYKQILQAQPEHPEANHLMGTLAHQLGRNDLAIAFLERAIQFNPLNANFHNVLGLVLRAEGEVERAIKAHKRAIEADPQMAAAYNSLAIALKDNNELDQALVSVRKAIQLAPQLIEAHNNLGTILSAQGQTEDAIAAFEDGLKIAPNFVMLRYNYAREVQKIGDNEKAAKLYATLIKDAPDFTEAYSNYGQVLRNLGQPIEAINILQKAAELAPDVAENYYNLGLALASVGQNVEAIACFEGAYTIKPDYAFAYNDHGNAILALGRAGDAIPSFKKAIEIAPEYAGIHNNLGHAYIRHGDLERAQEAISKALAINPNYARAYNNMGVIHQEFGAFNDAHAMFSHALKIDPNYREANSNLLFTMNYDPDKSGEEIFSHYQKFSRKLTEKVAAEPVPYTNAVNPEKRLKIGYVAPTFYHHAVSYHMLPLFDNCTHDRFEVYAYADIEKVDAYTEQYRSNCDHFFQTKGMSDEQLEQKIRNDQIDILVDIAGHTRNNRLSMFARKPAPIALHWLDFGYTTGMPEIDYYLGDANVTPEDQDHLFGEKQVWRLDGPSVVYRPGTGMGDVSDLPALENGFITFGTLSRTVRLNEKTIRTWAEILKNVPNAKLRFDSRNFTSESMCNRIAHRFEAHGIDRDRLIMGYVSPPWDVLREIDIALDCFPHNSGTTLFEHLYMGNPYVTLYNRASVGTLGGAILRGGGFGEWVAHNEDEYVSIAVDLASDLKRLADIRKGMRAKMQASPLMDEKSFVERVETAYRQMWTKWCENQ